MQCSIKVVHYYSNRQETINKNINNKKRNKVMSTIITVTTIMSMYMNLTADTENSKFFYNANIEDGKVVAIEVYNNNGESLSANLKRLYTYDEQDRLVVRETLKWNKRKMAWEKHSCLAYSYNTDGYNVEKHMWDETKHDYAQANERNRYTVVMDNVLAVNSYKLNKQSGNYDMADNMLIIAPDTSRLMAME
ncbi:MAG: DUF3836 domain-containing protein [Prevotella sp.]